MVQEPAHVFHCLPGIPAQLGGRVAEDVDTSGCDAGLAEVALEIAIERAAGQSLTVLRT